MPTELKEFKVELTTLATVTAIVFVDAIDEKNALEIARTSCRQDDFEIVTIGDPEARIVEE